MDIRDEEFINAVKTEYDLLGLWSLFLELGGMLFLFISFAIAQSFIPELKNPNMFVSGILFLIACAIVWGGKVLIDNALMKIAYIRAYEKHQPTDKILDWANSFHVFFKATNGREPTNNELNEALENWQQNNPQR